MNQKLTKSPTEISLTLPLSKGVSKFPDYSDYSASQPCSKESPAEKDPQNTPKSFLKPTLSEKPPIKKLANILGTTPDPYKLEKTVVDHRKSPRDSLLVKNKKILQNNFTKVSGLSNTSELDLARSKELAKMAISKMMVRDITKKRKKF